MPAALFSKGKQKQNLPQMIKINHVYLKICLVATSKSDHNVSKESSKNVQQKSSAENVHQEFPEDIPQRSPENVPHEFPASPKNFPLKSLVLSENILLKSTLESPASSQNIAKNLLYLLRIFTKNHLHLQ